MDLEQSQKKPCPRCGKGRTESGGSITQWIFACNCSDTEIVDDRLPLATMCQTCGKRQERGRPGSFTQWVFRQDICSCQQPNFHRAEANDTNSGAYIVEREPPVDEAELEVNPNKFPLSRYKPLIELGRGAAGTVYLCRDRLLGTRVAVKVLNVLTSEKLVSFQNEAKATSRLNHKNIVKILDFGATESGYPYMTMERFEGQSLERHLLEHGALSVPMAVSIISDVAAGLEYAHEKGIFHRDIKPSNLLINFDDAGRPEVMIIDFGVAQLEAGSQEPTIFQGRTMVGSPKYMSPDQANGLPYDERSEVYSVGCVLFESLAGQAPFDGETPMEIISKHANEVPPSLSEVVQDDTIPASLEQIVERTLLKEPDRRIQSMTELKRELTKVLQQDTSAGFTLSQSERAKPPNRVILSSVVVLVLVLSSWALLTALNTSPTETDKNRESMPSRAGLSALPEFKNASQLLHTKSTRVPSLATLDPTKFQFNEKIRYVIALPNCKDSDLDSLKGLEFAGLDLESSNATDATVKKLRELALPFKTLVLEGTVVTDACVEDLNRMSNIDELRLSLTAVSDNFLKKLKMPQLKSLELDGCDITDAGFSAISRNCPLLDRVEVARTRVSAEGLKHLSQLRELNYLNMSHKPVDDRMIDILKTMSVETLQLTGAKVSVSSIKELSEVKSLKKVELSEIPTLDKQTFKWLRSRMPGCTLTRQQTQAGADGSMMDFIETLAK